MLRWAIIFLIISLAAGAFGFVSVSELTRRISFILFGLFFIGFVLILLFALLVVNVLDGVSLGTDVLVVAAQALTD